MTARAQYHRGNLREELLARAVAVLRERGASALSLRELARDVGVSHAAPARHFADRRSLLDAVAVQGFALFAERIRDAAAAGDTPADRAHSIAHAYLSFMTSEQHLAEVMFGHEDGQGADAIGRAATAAFAPIAEIFAPTGPREPVSGGGATVSEDGATTTATLFLATLQGIAALVSCGVVPAEAVSGLVSEAVPRFVGSPR